MVHPSPHVQRNTSTFSNPCKAECTYNSKQAAQATTNPSPNLVQLRLPRSNCRDPHSRRPFGTGVTLHKNKDKQTKTLRSLASHTGLGSPWCKGFRDSDMIISDSGIGMILPDSLLPTQRLLFTPPLCPRPTRTPRRTQLSWQLSTALPKSDSRNPSHPACPTLPDHEVMFWHSLTPCA